MPLSSPPDDLAGLQSALPGLPPHGRGTFCNRTLNLRTMKAIGYDMDYTLIHYRVEDWERHAYEHLRRKLAEQGFPVEDLTFDPQRMIRGLIIDSERGNIVKVNRFGYVKLGQHGTRKLELNELRRVYGQALSQLGGGGQMFVDTLFALSEACMYAQLVDRLDAKQLPEAMGYRDLYAVVRRSLDEAHAEGQLKAEILANPDRFVELDPETALALKDQRESGKKLILITNSEWHYTREMMAYAFDRFVPGGGSWKDLFDIVIVSSRKPGFFGGTNPMFEIVDDAQGLLRPCTNGMGTGKLHLGGNAKLLEAHLGLSGSEILYVGDHIYADVLASKDVQRWRTALVLRELEPELVALELFEDGQRRLSALMHEKEAVELELAQVRLARQRKLAGYGPAVGPSRAALDRAVSALKGEINALDDRIQPLAQAAGQVGNPHWGPLMRTGNDKSYLARQVERYADIYTSRVSNLVYQTPFQFLLSPRGSLPHDLGFGKPPASARPDLETRVAARGGAEPAGAAKLDDTVTPKRAP